MISAQVSFQDYHISHSDEEEANEPIEEKRVLTLEDDEMWSDEESDYLVHVDRSEKKMIPAVIDRTKGDKKACKLFSGNAKTEYNMHDFDKSSFLAEPKEEIEFDIPLPYVAPHLVSALGEGVVKLIWKEFLDHGSDESELVLTEHIASISENIHSALGYVLPFSELTFTYGEEDYTDFQYVISGLASVKNRPGEVKNIERPIQLPPCCTNKYCAVHARMDRKVSSGSEKRPDFRLDVIYRRWVLDRRGIVRVRHIPEILAEADIAHRSDLLPESFWQNQGDFLVITYEMLADIADKIREDVEDREAQMDIYRLPKWLTNEFTPSEIAMFKHHFMMIDIDCGGTIDAEELMLLGDSLGNKMSYEEAAHLISEHDEDGSGSIDFEEFMGLMFKMMHGTVDVEDDALAKAMMESRSQIRIFEEIEGIKNDPPESVSVYHYGGNPVECEFLLDGPLDTPYEGGKFILHVVYNNGYPFNCPQVCFKTRLVHINLISQINGSVIFPHMKNIWESSWTSRHIVKHALELMAFPSPSLLPPTMIDVYNAFVIENFEVEDESVFIKSQFSEKLDIVQQHSGVKNSFKLKLDKLARLEQMHMNIVVKYFTDPETYESLARQFVQQYSFRKGGVGDSVDQDDHGD